MYKIENISNPYKYFDKQEIEYYEPTVIKIKNFVLITRIGQCFTRSGYLRPTMYANTFVFVRSLLIALLSIIRRGVSTLPNDGENVAIVHTPWTAGYYHWITESLPRLLACREQGQNIRVLLPTRVAYSGYEKSIALLGIHDVDYFPEGKNVVVRNAIITTVPRNFGTTCPAILQRIRETYTLAVIGERTELATKRRRVYVSRKLARGRKVVNEDAVISLLAQYGFEVVAFENHEFSAQVKLMAETEALVSIHGAALTNMIFMPSGGQVLEFVPHKRPLLDFNIVRMSFKHDPCYMRLASAMGHRYFLQPCTPVNIPDRTTHMADIIVDITLLQQNIDSRLARAQREKHETPIRTKSVIAPEE